MKSYFYNLDMQRELHTLRENLPNAKDLKRQVFKLDKLIKLQQEQLINDENIIVWSFNLDSKITSTHYAGKFKLLLDGCVGSQKFIERIKDEDQKNFIEHLQRVKTGEFSEVYYCFLDDDKTGAESYRHSVVEQIIDNTSYVVDRELSVEQEEKVALLLDEEPDASCLNCKLRYQKLFDSIPIPIIYKDKNRCCIGCNEEMKKVFDLFNIDNFVGLKAEQYGQYLDDDIISNYTKEEEKLLASGGSVTVHASMVDKNGLLRNFIITSSLIDFGNDDSILISAVTEFTKVLEYKNNFEMLNNQFYKIMNIMGEALIYYDDKLDVILANRAAQKLYQSSLDGKNLKDIIDHDSLADTIIGELENKQNNNTITLSKKMGKDYFEITYYPLYKHKKLNGLVMLIKDITARVNADRRNFLQQQQLLQADKLSTLGTLVSGVAHEINNPANFISINSSILKKIVAELEPILNFYYRENGEFTVANFHCTILMKTLGMIVTGLQEGVDRISNIVNNLKEYSRDHVVESHELVNLNNAVNKAITILQPEINQSTRNLVVDLDENLPLINGDILKLEQVIINILQNSCHSLDDYDKLIRVRTYCDKALNGVVLVVEDEGVGIKRKYLQKIKDPFFTTKRDSGGTGLGLSICVAIIQEHNGVIEIKSEENIGTITRILIPIAD